MIELLVTVAVIGILASLLMPALLSAKQRAKSARCLSNLRQLGIAVRLYGDENGGRLPRARSFARATNRTGGLRLFEEVVVQQVRGLRDVLTCPGDKGRIFERDGSSYEWNTALNGRILHRIGEENHGESKTFLLRDREGWHPRGRRNAVFVDGHAAEFSHK